MTKEEIEYYSNCSWNEWVSVRFSKGFISTKDFDFEMRTKNLLDVKEVLDGVGLKFWLTNGTALAAYRDKDWIPWDDDVDLDVMMEEYLSKHDKIRDALKEKGFVTRSKKIGNPRLAKMAFFRGGEKTAIRPLYIDPSFKNNEFRLRQEYKYPKKFYEIPGTIEFKGATFNIPSPAEEFLEFCYGKDWRTPLKSDIESVYSTKDIRR